MSIFQKLSGRSESAIRIWRDHFATARSRIDAEDRKIRLLYENLISEEASANAALASDPTTQTVLKSIDSTARRIAAERSYQVYQANNNSHDKIEKALNPKLLKAAIREAREMFEREHTRAKADIERLAKDLGSTTAGLGDDIERRLKDRLFNLEGAETAMRNMAESPPDHKVLPWGMYAASQYFETAMAE